MLRLFNTYSRKKEIFKPLKRGLAGLYTCGPTVYNYAHIGNLRTYIFEDILRRSLVFTGFKVRHVMNITNVGHLTSDADGGEDKLEKEAKKEQKSPWEIARFYTKSFLNDLKRLNIKKADVLSPATKNINEQINIIRELFKKGYAYDTSEAVYFNASKFKNYTKLSRQNLEKIKIGSREEVITKTQKRNPHDFVLWFKRVGRFKNHIMHWSAPWGDGFPGWHIECSAISSKYLGQPFDIHTGGIDHIYPHHTNEIAQSEAAFKKPLAKYWMHGEFLVIDGSRMGKSKGNFITLENLIQKKINPLAFRYFVMNAHYRSKLNFTWEALEASKKALERLYEFVRTIKGQGSRAKGSEKVVRTSLLPLAPIYSKFFSAISDDLNTPKAFAILWNLIHDFNKNPQKYDPKKVLKILYEFDEVLGLGFKKNKSFYSERSRRTISNVVLKLVEKREQFRRLKNWSESDKIRQKIKERGYIVEDTLEGPKLSPVSAPFD